MLFHRVATAATLSIGLLLASLAQAQATTISDFDQMDNQQKSEIVSDVLQQLIGYTAKKGGREMAQCMVDVFTKTNVNAGASAPIGMLALSAQLEVQRAEGEADNVQVENIVKAVFGIFLEDRCLPKSPKSAQGNPQSYQPG